MLLIAPRWFSIINPVLGCFLTFLFIWENPGICYAEMESGFKYEVTGEATVKKENYMRARKKAVKFAFQNALERALHEILGESVVNSNQKKINRLLRKARHFVKSYRFIETINSPVEKITRVKLEVTLFTKAINQQLSSLGVMKSLIKERTVIILIHEKSLSTETPPDFWDYTPIAEVALLQNLTASGIQVVNRNKARELIDEQSVIDAAQGDISSAVDIGIKVGADIVIVGNAISSRVGDSSGSLEGGIQSSLNIKAISALKSMIIAAKSEMARVNVKDDFQGELQAFELASKKMAGFLLGAMNRYWNPVIEPNVDEFSEGNEINSIEPEQTKPPQAPIQEVTPQMMDDL